MVSSLLMKAKEQIKAVKEKTKVYGEKLRTKKIYRKCGCECDAWCYLFKKADGTYWWTCKECGKEERAKMSDITERQVIFLMEEVK